MPFSGGRKSWNIASIHQIGYLSSVTLQKKLAALEDLYNRHIII